MGTRSRQCRPKVPGGLPFPVPEILEFVAFRDSEKFSSNFPGAFPENPRTDPRNSHSLLESSESLKMSKIGKTCGHHPKPSKTLCPKTKVMKHKKTKTKSGGCEEVQQVFAKMVFAKMVSKQKLRKPRAAKRGGFKRGVSRSGLVLPFLSFFVLFLSFFGTFPIFAGFSRFTQGRSGDFPDSSLFSFSAH